MPAQTCRKSVTHFPHSTVALTILMSIWLTSPAVTQTAEQEARTERIARELASLSESVANLAAAAKTASDVSSFGYYKDANCVLGAYLTEGQGAGINTRLRAGKRYMFLGGGDSNARDVDIRVLNAEGDVLAKDTDTDATPVVTFRCPTTGDYAVRISLYSARKDSFCTLVLLEEGGWSVPVERLAAVYANFAKHAVAVSAATIAAGGQPRLFGSNGFTFFGAVLEKGESSSLSNVILQPAAYAFLAVGDDEATDVDVVLKEGTIRTVGKDTDDDAIPIVLHRVGRRGPYRLEIGLPDARARAIVFGGVLMLEVPN